MSVPRTICVSELGFPEGPVALPGGGIAFVDLRHQKIRIHRNGSTREICSLPGSPNGMRLGRDGMLYVTNNGGVAPESLGMLWHAPDSLTGRLHRVSMDGHVTDFAVDLPGSGPWRPNDLVFTPEGTIIFTDPQNLEVFFDPDVSDPEVRYAGGRLLLAEQDGTTRLLNAMTGFPNGLAFHPDGSLLIALTMKHSIVQFDWNGQVLANQRLWHRFDNRFNPDGIAIAADAVFVAGSTGDRVAVLDLAGSLRRMVDTGDGSDPTNLCVADDALWVTLGLPGQVVAYRLEDFLANC